MISQDLLNLDGESVLVTGGTGSFGRRFVKFALEHFKPRRLVVFSRDEMKQHEMAAELSPQEYPCLRYFIGDVRDRERLERAMKGVRIVVHSAALKHVPIAEYNPFECIATNINGTQNVIDAAISSGVRRVIGLSTDKAVNPINLYGASKLAAEKLLVAANNFAGEEGPRFSVARYGNVVGSRGSVVPLFRRLLSEGAESLPITDERMTRFWITLDQGVAFVLSSLAVMHGGEIFVPKLKSVRIVDLAEVMAPGLGKHFVGIRPGEKLHETMISVDEARGTLELDDRYVVQPPMTFWQDHSPGTLDGTPVSADFSYASGDEALFLDKSEIQSLLQ